MVALAAVVRSTFTESIHSGAAVVVTADDEVVSEHGDSSALIYPRSTLKLLQAVGMLRAGLDLTGEHLALAAASHLGTAEHVRVVREILAGAGLTEENLQCPADWPADRVSRASASAPHRVTMGCSGKHAAMLRTCVRNGWPIENYLDPGHPLQAYLRTTVEQFADEPTQHVGVDGCGTPVFSLSLRGLARAVSRVASSAEAEPVALVAAITAAPWALDTPTVARVISELGVIAKTGAEGVFVAATPGGTAVALKIMDGSSRALVPVGLSLLAKAGVIDFETANLIVRETTEPVVGAGKVVGELRSLV